MGVIRRRESVGVKVGAVQVGGGAPVVVQSMANTDTSDVLSTAAQCIELAQAGSEMVRVTVNLPEAAKEDEHTAAVQMAAKTMKARASGQTKIIEVLVDSTDKQVAAEFAKFTTTYVTCALVTTATFPAG